MKRQTKVKMGDGMKVILPPYLEDQVRGATPEQKLETARALMRDAWLLYLDAGFSLSSNDNPLPSPTPWQAAPDRN